MIGSVLLAPVAMAQLQAIPLYGLIEWVTWSRAHKSSVGAARKVSPNWSQETMTCHSSNCFSIVRGQGQPPPQALRFSHGRGERETSNW